MTDFTRGRSGRWLLIPLALAVTVALVIAISPGSASGDEVQSGVVEVLEDAGVLVLSSGPSEGEVWVKYFDDPTEPLVLADAIASQSFSFKNCEVLGTAEGTDDLVAISGSGGRDEIALVNNGFGVRDKGNCSTAQGEVNDGQSMTIALSGYFGDGYSIKAAEIDVEGKHNAAVNYSFDGQDAIPAGTADLSESPDNDPDSGAADNHIPEIVFPLEGSTTLTLWPSGESSLAAISIEGGGDGEVANGDAGLRHDLEVNGTVFQLQRIKRFVDCGGLIVEPGLDGEAAEDVTVYRQDKQECDPETEDLIEFTLDIDETGVTFNPGDYEPTLVTFLVRIDWDPYADPFNPPHRRIILDGEPPEFVVACRGQSSEGSDMQMDPDADDMFDHPSDGEAGFLPWCLAGQQHVLLDSPEAEEGDAEWQQVQWYHGGTDPRWI